MRKSNNEKMVRSSKEAATINAKMELVDEIKNTVPIALVMSLIIIGHDVIIDKLSNPKRK